MKNCDKCDNTGFTPWHTVCLDHPPCRGCIKVRDYCKCKTGRAEYDKTYGNSKNITKDPK